ncbi:MAG: DUF3987 domain-containing protein [Enterobacteriaceae bacterium]|uniref:DUF3987 domain-containing protein n=1 Tax=Enterobacterales TaxID=91347 RepID=UPI0015DD2A8D|nr:MULTISPECIES: DUF3987 domain-containing protein [Enterobacterales]MDU1246486.1 DUF3987 domain-containing protein [Enterobacteriaceae bacterium]HDV8380553.1 DUF3987 domain-containing protein [Citrobacter freundii]MCE9794550.1 DUF3987 domain-containing protein [Citrobacter portucalensis]MDM2882004.1 YfjI family protein [Citrobacter sp. Cpo044]BBR19707.1 hypothetical protein WP3S18E05_11870 [Klebsiella sp. WP3-S18-ESBL-05]
MNNIINSKRNQELNFKIDMLPHRIRKWVLYLHFMTGVAIEIVVLSLLAFLGLACQDLFCIQLGNKQRFPLSLFLLLLSRSGSGKSKIFRLLKEPFSQLEREYEAAYLAELKVYDRSIILWEGEFKVLNKLYEKALNRGGDITETSKNLEECIGRKPNIPVRKTFFLTNPTSEALAKAIGLGYQNRALFNDEATAVFKGSLFNNPAFFNTYWCGDKVTIDRASSESFVIENYAFSFYLMMQPQPYDNTSRQKRANIRDTGLLARTLMIDMEQITEPCIINGHYIHDDSVLHELYSVMMQHVKAGVKRRENNDEYIALTLAPDAQELMDVTSLNLQQQMKPGGSLRNYDDIGSRFIEQSLRIAGVFEVSCNPSSTVIKNENMLSALKMMDWFTNHNITKIDATREFSDDEKIVLWLESNLVKNGSYDFRRNDIIKKGPLSTRCSERLMSALTRLESKGMVQLYDEAGVNYVKFIGSKMDPVELAVKTNTPIIQAGSLTLSKLPKVE